MRTIGPQERSAIRRKALEAVRECGNISKVSRDFGISRQNLHRWLSQYPGMYSFSEKRRGRKKQMITLTETQHILEILAYNLPSDLGIDGGLFWSVSSIRELLHRTMGMNSSDYLARKWLMGTSIFNKRNTCLFEESSIDSEGLSVREFAEQHKWPCYVFWRSYIQTHAGSRHFQCVSSERGGIRFVGKKCEGFGRISAFLNKLQEVAKKDIVVIYDADCKVYYHDISGLKKHVAIFRKSKGKLEGLLQYSRLPNDIDSFLSDEPSAWELYMSRKKDPTKRPELS